MCLGQVWKATVAEENTDDEKIAIHAPDRQAQSRLMEVAGLCPDTHAHSHSHALTLTRTHTQAHTLIAPAVFAAPLPHWSPGAQTAPGPSGLPGPRGKQPHLGWCDASQRLPVSENKPQALDTRHECP